MPIVGLGTTGPLPMSMSSNAGVPSIRVCRPPEKLIVQHERRRVALVASWRRVAADPAQPGTHLGGAQLLPRQAGDGKALLVSLGTVGSALQPLLDPAQVRRNSAIPRKAVAKSPFSAASIALSRWTRISCVRAAALAKAWAGRAT